MNTNHESVNERYNENDLADEYKFRFDFQHSHMKAVQVLKACGCYDYQACEIKNYLVSLACKIIQTIRMEAIHNLPGYSDAEWSMINYWPVKPKPSSEGAFGLVWDAPIQRQSQNLSARERGGTFFIFPANLSQVCRQPMPASAKSAALPYPPSPAKKLIRQPRRPFGHQHKVALHCCSIRHHEFEFADTRGVLDVVGFAHEAQHRFLVFGVRIAGQMLAFHFQHHHAVRNFVPLHGEDKPAATRGSVHLYRCCNAHSHCSPSVSSKLRLKLFNMLCSKAQVS